MNKFKQCLYTVLLMATCFVASPFIFHQIWKTSAEAKKKVEIPPPSVTVPAETQPEAQTPQPGEAYDPNAAQSTPENTESGEPSDQPVQQPKPDAGVKYATRDESYFDDALFIGDSRTVGIHEYGTLKNADYFCDIGLAASTINKDTINGMTFDEAIDKKQYGKVYIMLGINEVGNDFEYTLTAYRAIVEKVKVHQPDAIIYLQANLHVSVYAETNVINNEAINYLNSMIASLADFKKVYYIDVNELYDDENGYLNSSYTPDGIHPRGEYYRQWCEWLCTKTIADDGAVIYDEGGIVVE